ncbi:hypothetical protein K431DRAFT_285170 [Polychaeton citri CBS 116435]|uniref:F-box domain-containing protein n=1 Tax=Polychaeton citri CBS 116435 TaxID=1314669 RepID=A0A9P4QAB9_9PEZI|nr:hypothetical protein K431DRAFT_285170 [Polychaeton citri CBS 116435]
MEHQALASPCILYHILLQLPQQDLLLVQRVCSKWHNIINSSKVLLAALFMHPGPTTAGIPIGPTQLNPLLESRFPSFFDNKLPHTRWQPTAHEIGPWYTTHWAESIPPWPMRVRSCLWPRSSSAPFKIPKLDPRRAAVYKHPEASWRRMIPCRPAPIELQCNYIYHRPPSAAKGTLRCLRFSNQDSLRDEIFQGNNSEVLKRPWLTFGLLYDIVEAGWFRGQPAPIDNLQFDYTFHDDRLPEIRRQHAQIVFPQHQGIKKKYPREYQLREELRDRLPQKDIGGRGHVLINLIGYNWRTRNKQYRIELELGNTTMERIYWDEEIEYGHS